MIDHEREEALRPCPFCGGDARPDSVPNGAHYAHCADCGAEGPVHESEPGAIKAWNARAQPQQEPVARLTPEAIIQAVARGWCHPKNSGKPMDIDLAEAIGAEIFAINPASPPAQAVPERKCGTCRDWHCFVKTDYSNVSHGRLAVGECSSQLFEMHARRYSKGKQVDSDFGCIFWQPREPLAAAPKPGEKSGD